MMPGKMTPLVRFIVPFLVSNSECLYWAKEDWIKRDEYVFCLECLRRNKKGYTSRYCEVFDKYYLLKPRNPCGSSCDKRQTLLQALKKCPFIEEIKAYSTKDKKFYKFVKIGKEKLEALIKDLTSKSLGADPNESNKSQGPVTMSAVGLTDKSCNIFSDSNGSEIINDKEFQMVLEYVKEDLDRMASDISEPEVGGTVSPCPDPTASDDIQSFYPDAGAAAQSLFSCSQYNSDFYDMGTLGEEEVSGRIVTESEDIHFIPEDYDPAIDLIQSLPAQDLTPGTASAVGLPNDLPDSPILPEMEIFNITVTEQCVKRSKPGQTSDLYMMVLQSLPS